MSTQREPTKKGIVNWRIITVAALFFIMTGAIAFFPRNDKEIKPLVTSLSEGGPEIWKIRSIDTMKMSRDKAREKINDRAFEEVIEKEMKLIKGMGANYVAVGTPYDDEFLPYLKKWVKYARENDLNVWYRGSFSGYEGWFGYQKNISPDQLLVKTEQFIAANKDLFKDGDIFDPCPECENGQFWPQPQSDQNYNKFVQKKHQVLKQSFAKINKNVIYNLNSIIGGRAKDVMDQETFDALGNIVAIDHYAKDLSSYTEYIKYFAKDHNTKLVFGEFGAPIPDLHGQMSEQKQAEFIESVFNELFKNSNDVKGINYWVLSDGTTAIINPDYTKRKAVDVIERYYKPAVLEGIVTDTNEEPVINATVRIANTNKFVTTNKNGFYQVALPEGNYELLYEGLGYNTVTQRLSFGKEEKKTKNIILIPTSQDLWYRLRQIL